VITNLENICYSAGIFSSGSSIMHTHDFKHWATHQLFTLNIHTWAVTNISDETKLLMMHGIILILLCLFY